MSENGAEKGLKKRKFLHKRTTPAKFRYPALRITCSHAVLERSAKRTKPALPQFPIAPSLKTVVVRIRVFKFVGKIMNRKSSLSAPITVFPQKVRWIKFHNFSKKGGTRPPSPREVNSRGSSPAVGRFAPSGLPSLFPRLIEMIQKFYSSKTLS